DSLRAENSRDDYAPAIRCDTAASMALLSMETPRLYLRAFTLAAPEMDCACEDCVAARVEARLKGRGNLLACHTCMQEAAIGPMVDKTWRCQHRMGEPLHSPQLPDGFWE